MVRQIISLNGRWEFEADNGAMPEKFTREIPVPGLVDMATPKINFQDYSSFWYRRAMDLSKYRKTEKVFLHIDQSKYGTEAWFNGNNLGIYHGCYTSFEFDITDYVNWAGENILIVKVGTRDQIVDKSAVGHDGEMKYNIPGIWGDTSLIMTGNIYMKNIQVLSDMDKGELETNIRYKNYSGLKEAKAKIKVVENNETEKLLAAYEKDVLLDENEIINIRMPIKDYKLWSLDTPFLYKMHVTILSDNKTIDNTEVNFGIREFKVKDRHFYLNGKQIFLRGSNIAFHRFLSDPQRGNLPWDESWIKRCLIDIPKEHNMNIFRMHIGHVYNKWYDIADRYGMMIQDEWAFFGITGTKEAMDQEYTQWIMDNWNHPSIIIWDPMNEVRQPYVEGTIVPKLKKLDPSQPWEVVDFMEDHCYIYSNGPVLHKTQCGPCPPIPELLERKTPLMINEYLWFWLDSKGMPTFFCNPAVQRWIGKNTSSEENLTYQAFLVKELTELWRRLGVDATMPFVYLSIDGAYTSNYFLGDIKDLKPKPILKALKEAFSPFGVSIELWDRHFYVNEKRRIYVYIFNDNPIKETGQLACQIVDAKTGKVVSEEKFNVEVEPSGSIKKEITWKFPEKEGEYILNAVLMKDGKFVTISQKPAYVFETPKVPATLKGTKVKVWSESGEIATYLKNNNIDAGKYDFKLDGKFILIVEGQILNTEAYKQSLPGLTKFVKGGGTLLVIEPSYGTPKDKESKIDIVENLKLLIIWKLGIWAEGYDSYIHPDEGNLTHPIWAGLKKEHLRMFNGAWGGEVISECDVLLPPGGRVLSRNGNELKAANTVAFEYGSGAVIISSLQTRERLFNNKSDKHSLYNRREDPVLQRIFLNLLNAYRNPDEIKIRMQTDKTGVYKIFKEGTMTALLRDREIKLDASLDGWRLTTPIILNRNNSLESGEIIDDGDLSAKAYFMWDSENLYFAAEIEDDAVIQNKENENIWQDDCVELFIDPQGNGLRWGNSEDLQIGLAPDPGQQSGDIKVWEWFKKDAKVYKSIKGKYRLTEKGYIIEAAIPWNAVGLQPKSGLKFNLSVAVHDTDSDKQDFAKTAKLNYYFRQDDDKTTLGTIELRENP